MEPGSFAFLRAEVGNIPLVELQFRLNVSEQGVGILFGLAHQDHAKQFLHGFQPHGYEDVEVGALGVASGPLGAVLDSPVFLYGVGSLDLERGALGVLAGGQVIGIVGEVVIDKSGVIRQQALDAGTLLRGRLLGGHDRIVLHRFAPVLPLLQGFFPGYLGRHTLNDHFVAEHFEDVLVLVLVDHLTELGGDFRVGLGLVLKPFAESHEALDKVHDGRLFIELVDGGR